MAQTTSEPAVTSDHGIDCSKPHESGIAKKWSLKCNPIETIQPREPEP